MLLLSISWMRVIRALYGIWQQINSSAGSGRPLTCSSGCLGDLLYSLGVHTLQLKTSLLIHNPVTYSFTLFFGTGQPSLVPGVSWAACQLREIWQPGRVFWWLSANCLVCERKTYGRVLEYSTVICCIVAIILHV